MSSSATEAGPVSLGPFEIAFALAEGASSYVTVARDRRNGETVAIKIAKSVDVAAMRAFRKELDHARRIDHPNVVRVHELLVIDGKGVLSMEYVQGETFCEAVKSRAHDEAWVKKLFTSLVLACDAVHDVGLLHLDIKDENVRVTHDGRVVLLDLGVASGIDAARRGLSAAPGTKAFMAPEQAALLPLGPAADIYAMGVLFHLALCDAFPDRGNASESLALQVTRRLSRVSAALRNLVTRMLDPDPKRRPSARMILRALDGDPTRASSAASTLVRGHADLVSRTAELSALRACFQRARERPVLVALRGAEGTGKRAILQEAMRSFRADGSVVLSVTRRFRAQAPCAWDGCADLLEQLVRALAERDEASYREHARHIREASLLCPSIARLSERTEQMVRINPLERRFLAFDAVSALFQALSKLGPFVVTFDDALCLEPDFVCLLSYVLATCPPNVLILCASIDLPPPLANYAFEELSIGALSPEDSRLLCARFAELAGCDPDAALLNAAERRPCPLLLLELVRHRAFFGPSARLPGSLEDALDQRLTMIDDKTRAVLLLVSAAPIALDRDTLASALSLQMLDLERALNTLRVLGLVVFSELAFEDVIAPARHELAELAIRLLRDRVSDPDDLVYRALAIHRTRYPLYLADCQERAGRLEEAALLLEEEADRSAQLLAFHREERLRKRALSLNPQRAPQQRLTRYADAARHAGRLHEASTAYASAAQHAKVAERLLLERLSAACLLRSGEVDKARQALSHTLSLVGCELPTTAPKALRSLMFGRLLLALSGLDYRERRETELSARDLEHFDTLWSSGGLLALVDTFGGAALQIAGVRLALRLGEPSRVALALAQESLFRAGIELPPMPKARELVTRARTISAKTPDPRVLGACISAQGIQLSMCGEPRRSNVLLVEAEKHLSATGGADATLSLVRIFRVINHVFLGNARALAEFYPRYVERALQSGDRYEQANLITAGGYLLPLFAQRPEEALSEIDRAERIFVTSGFPHQHFQALIARLLVLSYVDAAKGYATLAASLPALSSSLLMRLPRARLLVNALGSQLAISASLSERGHEEVFVARARKHARALSRMGFAEATAFGFAMQGHIALRNGNKKEAARMLVDAVRAFEKLGHFEGWLNTYRLGRLVSGEEGRRQREQALSELAKRGAADPKWLAIGSLSGLYD